MRNNKDDNTLTVVYDGDCLFCNNLMHLAKIKSKFHEINLIDARQRDHPMVQKYKSEYNFDQGMLVVVGNEEYHGAFALNVLSMLGYTGIFTPALLFLFKNKTLSSFAYPFLKFGRAIFLFLRGKGFIGY